MGTQSKFSERTHGNRGNSTESNGFQNAQMRKDAFLTREDSYPHPHLGVKRYGGGSISRILFRIERAYGGDHVSTAYVTISLQQPTREPWPGRPFPNVTTHPRKRLSPCKAEQAVRRVLLFGLAPGDAYPAIHVAADAVGSYPTISPLPRTHPRMITGRFVFCGAHVGLLRLGVTQHPALWSPDFPLT